MSDTTEPTPTTNAAPAAATTSRRPLYAAVGAVALTALAGAGALAWNAKQAAPQADAASVSAPAAPALALASATQTATTPTGTEAPASAAAAGTPVEFLAQVDQALAPAVAMTGPFGAWFKTSTWTGFVGTGAGVAARAADPQVYTAAIQTYANPAIYIQQVLAFFQQAVPAAQAGAQDAK